MRTRYKLALAGVTLATGMAILAACSQGLPGSPQQAWLEQQNGQVATTAPATDTPTVPQTITPTPADFALTVTITDNQCFGSAGCDLSWTVRAAVPNVNDEWPSTFTVVYSIPGIEGGYTGSLDFVNGGAQFSSLGANGFGQTTHRVDSLTATVTSVVGS